MSLQIWMPMNGSIINQGLSDITPSLTGVSNTTYGKIYKNCANFTSGDYIKLSNTSFINKTNPIISIAFWIKTDSPSSTMTFFCNRLNMGDGISIFNMDATTIRFDLGGIQHAFKHEADFANWTHVCLTADGATKRLYINGALVKSGNYTNAQTNIGDISYIGAASSNTDTISPNATYFSGQMQDYRIYDHALSQKEIKELSYGLAAHYQLKGSMLEYNEEIDGTGYGNTLTKVSSPVIGEESPRYKNCINFNNTGYLRTSSFGLVTSQFTVAFWVKIPAEITSQHFLFGTHNSWTKNGFSAWRDVGKTAYSALFKSSAESSYSSISLAPIIDEWCHIVCVYTGTEIISYRNGVEQHRKTYGAGGTISHPVLYLGNSLYNNAVTSEIDEASMSDFRFYTTALSSNDIENLYKTAASVDDEYNFYVYELTEDEKSDVSKNGLATFSSFSDTAPIHDMKLMSLADGSAWARIHWLDVSSTATWFANSAEVAECIAAANRYSRMGIIDKFKDSDGKYEFLLKFPKLSATDFNRWIQTSSPNATEVTGLIKVTTAWAAHFGGIRKSPSANTIYDCDTGTTWFAPIGQLKAFTNNSIPAANGSQQREVELWVRIDKLPQQTSFNIYNKFITSRNFIEF